VKRVVVLLVMLNVLQLLVYLMHSWGGENAPSKFPPIVIQVSEKPWPHLPSFTSWAPESTVDPASCEAFFGNGFTQTFRVFESEPRLRMNLNRKSGLLDRSSFGFKQAMGARTVSKDEGRLTGADVQTQHLEATQIEPLGEGSFHCFYSETLRTSICEGKNMVMNPEKIEMSEGGEPLESVIGRNEEDELPYFTSGAFQIIVRERGGRKPLFNKTLLQYLMPQGLIQEHTMQHLLEQIHTIPLNEVTCAQIVTQPVVVVTRFEYANLFHTVTDWYSAYITARIANLKQRPQLIFVDGHCKVKKLLHLTDYPHFSPSFYNIK
jgi:glycoprotein 2-beta-D-xylosyltransferase